MAEQKIIARIILEVLGSPKEHVDETIKQVIKKLETEKGIRMIKQKTYESEEQKGSKLWSTFSEVELQTESIKKLNELCFTYMPSTIEVIDPAGMELDTSVISEFLNELLARLHKYDMVLKNLNAENLVMKHDLTLIRNAAIAAAQKKAKQEKK